MECEKTKFKIAIIYNCPICNEEHIVKTSKFMIDGLVLGFNRVDCDNCRAIFEIELENE